MQTYLNIGWWLLAAVVTAPWLWALLVTAYNDGARGLRQFFMPWTIHGAGAALGLLVWLVFLGLWSALLIWWAIQAIAS